MTHAEFLASRFNNKKKYLKVAHPPKGISYLWVLFFFLLYLGVVFCHNCFLCILRVRNIKGILLANLVNKNNTLPTPLPHLLPSLDCVTPRYNLTAGGNVQVLKLYNL